MDLTRRHLLVTGGLAAVSLAALDACSTPPPTATAAAAVFPVSHPDAQWRKMLTADQYAVLRQAQTEAPFSSPLDQENRRGVYSCAGCTLELYSSTTKFDSHTGWPSFWKALDNAVVKRSDLSLAEERTAVSCHRCGGHLGHVFDDGPPPTGLRYCMNGVAMTFRAT